MQELVKAIEEAIAKEQEDIGMYRSLLQMVPADRADIAKKIQGILNNEVRHMQVLRTLLPQAQ